MNESIKLSLTDITKKFGNTNVLNSITFDLKESEILGFLGPNGAGKTTTLYIILGLIKPTSGKINILGRDINSDRDLRDILNRMNFSSSSTSLPYSLTVEEVLTFFARLYGVKNRKAKIEELVEQFELSQIYKRTIRTLSTGQHTRLNLAKALVNDPEILLLDEPTANLDPDVADRVRDFFKNTIKNKTISIIYTSHNMAEMQKISDRIIFINKGKIVISGTPDEVISHFRTNNLEELFLKLVRGEVDNDA